MSFAQQRLWFLDQLEPGRPTYAIPVAVELCGALNVTALELALALLVTRHESLRTVFTAKEGRPLQIVTEPRPFTLPITDLSGELQADAVLDRLCREEISQGFNLMRGPLFRARLYRLGPERYVLLLAMHHIVADGWSLGILFRELGELYHSCNLGNGLNLPALPIEYRDFARWQRNCLQGANLERLLAHWRSRLDGAPQVLELPSDRTRPALESNRGATYPLKLPLELTMALRQFSRRQSVTLYMTLLSAFGLLIRRYTGEEDFLLGTPVAIRKHREFEGVVGCFVNTLVLRTDLSGDPKVHEYLGRMRQMCLGALQHQDLPFERLVEALQPVRDFSRNPVVQIMFSLENMPLQPMKLPGLQQRRLEIDWGVAHADLTLRVQETPDGLSAHFEYATDLFERPSIARLARHWRALLEAMIASPRSPISELPLLNEAERRQLLVEWNSTTTDYHRDGNAYELCEAQMDRNPESTAVVFKSERLTCGELDSRSNQVAHHLRRMGVGPGARVGICLRRSLEVFPALLGILKTGAAYVPLDPSFPEDRLRFVADDARLTALLSTAPLAGLFNLPRECQLLLDTDAQTIASAAKTRLPAQPGRTKPVDPAYVIYTSGSTGKPKGVIVPHRAVVNLLTSMRREPGLGAGDVLLAVTSLSFDIAVLELLLPLTAGATVIMATEEETRDGQALASLLEHHRCTVMQATPSTWQLLLGAGWVPKRPFKALVGGEAVPKSLADQLIARGVQVWDMYGPTETTVWSTCGRIVDTRTGISIGKPIANTIIRILDARKNLCPIGVPGELCIGGDGLSLGYWNQPELTAERFVCDPCDPVGARLYGTGDRARWREDGTLEFLGRLDRQIKLRGFRIEPAEIEAKLAQHPAVKESVIVAHENSGADKCLVAYFVAESPPDDLANQLRVLLRAAFPEYMIPAHFVMLDAMPRTPNGKLDHKALRVRAPEEGAPLKAAIAPRTATEDLALGVFRNVLGRTDFGVLDSFFDLGGHSLLAARLLDRLRVASGLDLPMRLLFEHPTPGQLAGAMDGLSWLEKSRTPLSHAGPREQIDL